MIPRLPDEHLVALRMRLMREEFESMRAESDRLLVALRTGGRVDALVPLLQSLVKKVCDLRYAAEETLVAYGVEPTAYEEVLQSVVDERPAEAELMFPSIIEGTICGEREASSTSTS